MTAPAYPKARDWIDKEFGIWLREEAGWSSTLQEMAINSILGAGKALRPEMVHLAWCCFEGQELAPSRSVRRLGLALEFVHTYSLVHDDLPAMDNDSFRRGRPTAHRLGGEAMAILLGDALLTAAFELVVSSNLSDAKRLRAVRELAHSSGGSGLIAGQIMDLRPQDAPSLENIHQKKTGELFGAALVLGALCSHSEVFPEERLFRLKLFGRKLGVLFQAQDDLLDAIGTSSDLGKTAGKDRLQDKRTFVSEMGVPATQAWIAKNHAELLHEAKSLGLGAHAAKLVGNLVHRNA